MSEASNGTPTNKDPESIEMMGGHWLSRPISVAAANYCAFSLVAVLITFFLLDLPNLSDIASRKGGFLRSAQAAGLCALITLLSAIVGTAIGGLAGLLIDYCKTLKFLRQLPPNDRPTVNAFWHSVAAVSFLSASGSPYTLIDLFTALLWTIRTLSWGAVGFLFGMRGNPLFPCLLFMLLYQFWTGWRVHTRFRKGVMKSWTIDDIAASGLSLDALSRDTRERLLTALTFSTLFYEWSIFARLTRPEKKPAEGRPLDEPRQPQTIGLWYMTAPAVGKQIMKDGLKGMGRIDLRLKPGQSRHDFSNIFFQLPFEWLLDVHFEWNRKKQVLEVFADIPSDYIADFTGSVESQPGGDAVAESPPEDAD